IMYFYILSIAMKQTRPFLVIQFELCAKGSPISCLYSFRVPGHKAHRMHYLVHSLIGVTNFGGSRE
ncbi:MAG: hypothetical protein RR705_11470, partial [Lachnospiraceae bacterium]